jgi:hypothetical protein
MRWGSLYWAPPRTPPGGPLGAGVISWVPDGAAEVGAADVVAADVGAADVGAANVVAAVVGAAEASAAMIDAAECVENAERRA